MNVRTVYGLTGVVTTPRGTNINWWPTGIQEIATHTPAVAMQRIVTTRPNIRNNVSTIIPSVRNRTTTMRTLHVK